MEHLSIEILDHIFGFLPLMTRILIRLVCKSFRGAIRESYIPYKQLLDEGVLHYSPEMLKKMKFYETFSTTICERAAFYGKLDTLALARENDCSCGSDVCISAAKNGHVNILDYLNYNDCPWVDNAYVWAAREGHLKIIEYFTDLYDDGHDAFHDPYACALAAKGGHINVLRWLRAFGCPWNILTPALAAQEGHIEVLKYAHENECAWDHLTTTYAAEHGRLEILKYAHENGCPWNAGVTNNAAQEGHLDILKYAVENGCPIDKNTCLFLTNNKDITMYLNTL